MRKFSALAFMFIAPPAFAANWNVDASKSTLTFSGTQSGDPFNGSFPKFTPEIDFDEAAPEKGHIHVTIDMASATIDGKDRQDSLPTDDWFGVKKFPRAEFTSTAIKKTGEHQYAATGTLNLHGASKEITLPFTLKPEGAATRAEGSTTLARNDYNIGQGRWKDDQWVAFPVKLTYSILATK